MRYAPTALLLAALALLAVACGGDDDDNSRDSASSTPSTSLSAESIPWVESLEVPLQLYETIIDGVDGDHPDAFTTGDGIQAYADEMLDDNGQVVARLDDLDEPPAEFVAVYTAYRAAYDELMALIGAPPAVPDDIQAAMVTVDDACEGLQAVAGSVVDLRCTGEDTPIAFADYYDEVIPLLAAAHDEHDAAQAAFDALAPDAPEEVRRAAVEAYVSDVSGGYLTTRTAMRVLEAPDEVSDAHEAYRDAAGTLRDVVRDIEGVLEEDPSAAGTDAALAMIDESLLPALLAVRNGCAVFQGIADQKALGIDFDCEK